MAMIGAPDPTARSGGTADGEGDSSDFTCPVCLEIFDRPVTTQCGHTFCNSCLQECLRTHKPICAVCRTTLDKWARDTAIETLIQKNTGPCKGCQTQVRLSQMRSHTAVCSKYQEYIDEGVRSTTQSQPAVRWGAGRWPLSCLQPSADPPVPNPPPILLPPPQRSSVPNRFTFSCPYCNFQNLDQDGLVEHCTSLHARDTRHVVCPICASMPWGDPNYRSADFFQHLKIRHTFSYDTFVDYSADEHTMIQEALQRSLMDK
ncbi:E3 ubiquitin-protein ligase RNF114 isoform X1 [Brienomyrus brachyistius]|uniref:E3 ubiquitin-protein ligase RNF114 isoform X1 n=1 Tax=Brienomyrus brachyistius TaxID=42636 RepID=UPI0020B33959|nr:E3 ubiquitin-protein ligase RNF114 isoform X1 [Brienomyrus brachyistius]